MVKIPNEVKIGTMAIAAIGLLIMGFNFLKGRDLFKNGNFLYAKYPNAKGLMVSNGVFINGFKVGSVYDIASSGLDLKEMVVTIKLSSPYHIPTNSIASIKESALSAPSIEITLGNNDKFLTSGDTMLTGKLDGLFGKPYQQIRAHRRQACCHHRPFGQFAEQHQFFAFRQQQGKYCGQFVQPFQGNGKPGQNGNFDGDADGPQDR